MYNIFFSDGKLNKNRLRENWASKNLENYKDIKAFQAEYHQQDLKFSQIIFNFINEIKEIPKCNTCHSHNKRFIGFREGYNNFCSKKCAHVASSPVAQITRKKNTIAKYGVEHTSMLESVKKKQLSTNLSKYGTKSPTLNDEVRNKQHISMISKYSVRYSGESKELLQKSLTTRFENYKKYMFENYKDLDIVSIPSEGNLEIRCDICKNIYHIKTSLMSQRLRKYKVIPCIYCNPISSYESSGHNEIANFLRELGEDIVIGNREILSGQELDIYIPDKNIAIEFNGLYWHSTLFKDKKYHLNKKVLCENQKIKLIHIWEDDWKNKKEIVKSRLKNILNKSTTKIWARKCRVKQIDNNSASKFIEENHLQGSVYSKFRYGLFRGEELVAVMTFGNLRKSLGQNATHDSFELYRFCCKNDYSVVGGFSKLLNFFTEKINPTTIITYANRDWSTENNVYEKNGFDFISFTPVNYWYFDKANTRKHRFSFRKDRLTNKDLTEVLQMEEKGYLRIYDCGSLKYKLSLKIKH
jgi:hypothetical protein